MAASISGVVPLSEFLQSPQRLFIDIWAMTGQGKSFFPLSWPQPIIILNYEPEGPLMSLKNAVGLGTLKEDAEVFIIEPVKESLKGGYPLVRTEEQDEKIFEWTKDVVREVADEYEEGTLVFDTMTTFHDILNSATMLEIKNKREKQGKEIMGFDWGVRNRAFRGIIEGIRAKTNLNLVTLEHASEVYKGPVRTGRYESAGPNRLDQWVDMTAKLVYDPVSELDWDDGGNWILQIGKSRANIGLQGRGLDNPTYERLVGAIDGDVETLEL